MKRKMEFNTHRSIKRQKIDSCGDYDMDDCKDIVEETTQTKSKYNFEILEIFCKSETENKLLSESMEKKENTNIRIFEYRKFVHVDGCKLDVISIKDSLKHVGFRWKEHLWTMKKHYFVSDYDLFIREILQKACAQQNLTFSVFDFGQKRKEILSKHINVFIYYDQATYSIYLKTNVDEEIMMSLLDKHNYKIDDYADDDMNIYAKHGILYEGHIETWKEHSCENDWVLGYDTTDMKDKPRCVQCHQLLTLHKVRKEGINKGRRFYNCYICYHSSTRMHSFVWADGDMDNKLSELVVQQNLTQPFSQFVL